MHVRDYEHSSFRKNSCSRSCRHVTNYRFKLPDENEFKTPGGEQLRGFSGNPRVPKVRYSKTHGGRTPQGIPRDTIDPHEPPWRPPALSSWRQ